jgi:hypothetical protein
VRSLGHTLFDKVQKISFSHIPCQRPSIGEYTVTLARPDVTPQEMNKTQNIAVELGKSLLKLQEENHNIRQKLRDTESNLRA